MVKLGGRYPEIKLFQLISGIGVVGSYVFNAFIQTPHRFATKRRLCKYFRLGVIARSSAGKPLTYKRPDRSEGILKALSR